MKDTQHIKVLYKSGSKDEIYFSAIEGGGLNLAGHFYKMVQEIKSNKEHYDSGYVYLRLSEVAAISLSL
jgi:hypothetical protein